MNSSKRRIEKLESASFDKVKEETLDLNNITTTSFKYVNGTSTNVPYKRIFILRYNDCSK